MKAANGLQAYFFLPVFLKVSHCHILKLAAVARRTVNPLSVYRVYTSWKDETFLFNVEYTRDVEKKLATFTDSNFYFFLFHYQVKVLNLKFNFNLHQSFRSYIALKYMALKIFLRMSTKAKCFRAIYIYIYIYNKYIYSNTCIKRSYSKLFHVIDFELTEIRTGNPLSRWLLKLAKRRNFGAQNK